MRCSVLSGAYAAADSCSWQGANRSDAQWHREDLQRGHGREGAAHKCRLALNTALVRTKQALDGVTVAIGALAPMCGDTDSET